MVMWKWICPFAAHSSDKNLHKSEAFLVVVIDEKFYIIHLPLIVCEAKFISW